LKPNRKEVILQQAMELIIENGLGGLTMSNVARRMEFTEPAMYRHFQNKEDLVVNLIQRVSGCLEEVFNQFDRNEPPAVFFPKYYEALLLYFEKVRGVTLLFLSESSFNSAQATRDELQIMFKAQNQRITSYLETAKSRGEILPDVDPTVAALVFLGTVQAITTRFVLSSYKISTLKSSRPALDIFLKGVVG
jgi:TetR/AcrR family transcriptional regulator, fatty acid metabolism regulator protein